MKKIASLLIVLSLVFAFAVSAFALTGENYALFSASSDVDIPINEHLGGDVNGDGYINLRDVVSLFRVIIGDPTNTLRDGVDVNCDGIVSVADVILTVRHVVGNDVGLGTIVTAE